MVELLRGYEEHYELDLSQLLNHGESVVIVDDSPEIVLILKHYLDKQGLPVLQAGSAAEFYQLLQSSPIALILLDIGLPDKSGIEILQDIVPKYPDLGIVMVTGTTNLDTALECLRLGADDYLTKPVGGEKLTHTLVSTLKKRKLAIENRHIQQELEAAHNRTRFLHQLNLQMNSVYLSNVELKAILRAILVGITSEEGLKFNRAFLALFSDDGQILEGKLAIGTTCRAEAGRVWDSIKQKNLQLQDIITDDNGGNEEGDVEVNRIISQLRVPVTDLSHILISAAINRQTIVVTNGSAIGCNVPYELLHILDHSSFVVVPLYSPSKSLGVLIVDNFVTHKQITLEEIHSLEIFASQASLAIEHSHLYEDMRIKIEELEMVNQELDKSKDLLVAAERYSAVGHMSAQLVHVIRNPITSIGGTARLLVKRTEDPYIAKFLKVISKEAAKIEATLEDLFNFVEERQLQLAPHQLYSLLRRCVMVFYTTMKNGNITYQFDLPGISPVVQVDGDRFRQVFLHLIKNGIEAMTGGGVLFVGCTYTENREDGIEVIIRDSGTGIADNHLQLVTDPFFTTKTYGTGMGLTLVEKITAMHGATFHLKQHEKGGMVAKVHLPAKMIV
ncbi:response regulator [Desulfopila sp. IMCC35008]|uniref:response regulator n=1 Tax=Desulfopila sp. IMCC35008 TaxID=2653858 RepID=UPI0013D88C32|nr:response regulator [Desulfopila sp. IMCC35008]